MSYVLFVDESGQDLRDSPYEVLAGIAVQDRRLRDLIDALHQSEENNFAGRYTRGSAELKGKKLLKAKVFRHASMMESIELPERGKLAKECLEQGGAATRRHLAALAQAKLAFVKDAFEVAGKFGCRCFASIVDRDAPRPMGNYLRKDYAYLFERFFYFLEDSGRGKMGLVVFDELEKSRSHILVDQMYRYFRQTKKGQQRSSRIIPEPFFVHSELTTGIQLADLAAYVINWGVRVHTMNRPRRDELNDYGQQVLRLRHQSVRWVGLNPRFKIWSLCVIEDLRPRGEKEIEEVGP